MKYVRLSNTKIVTETFVPQSGFTIEESFTPDVVAMFEACSDDVEIAWKKNNDGSFSPPPPVMPAISVTTLSKEVA